MERRVAGRGPSGGSEGGLPRAAASSSAWLPVFLGVWPQHPISASVVTSPPPPLRQTSLSFRLISIPVIALGAHLDSPGDPPPISKSLIQLQLQRLHHMQSLRGSRD